jgi:DNA-binding NarL/FixJ family response regulator
MGVLAFITDLFFQAKVAETAKQVGVPIKIVTSLYKFIPELKEGPSLVVIDLAAQGIDSQALISQVKNSAPDLPVVAYAAHVDTELIERAAAAGADQAMSRSKFSKQLPELLSGTLGD